MNASQRLTETDVTTRLDGTDCQFCADGSIRKGTYKGNEAAICDRCELPIVQVWSA